MALTTFLRVAAAQMVLAFANYALANYTGLDIPYPLILVPIIGALLNALAAWARSQVPSAQMMAGGMSSIRQAPFWARVF